MDKHLLLKPIPKPAPRGRAIQKKYPFPICGQPAIASTSADDPKPNWKYFIGHLKPHCVIVSDEESMNMLFNMGFFGKGTLSKRGPGFRSGEKNAHQNKGKDSSAVEAIPEPKRKKLDDKTAKSLKADPVTTSQEKNSELEQTVSSSASLKESLQLTFEEAFFLSYGLGCLVVVDHNNKPLDIIKLWKKFCELSSPNHNFPVMYTAYHHFRSKGWVVRSGLNYGADYVLYKDGPSFYHSTYAVIVAAVKEKDLTEIENSGRLPMTWSFLSALNRINTHVAKGVMFAFVVKPRLLSDQILATPLCLSRFKIQELLVKRWVPTAEREK